MLSSLRPGTTRSGLLYQRDTAKATGTKTKEKVKKPKIPKHKKAKPEK